MKSRDWKPQGESSRLLIAAQKFLHEYSEFITLRQLFYLMVDKGYLDNTESSWRKLKTLMLRARKHGRVSPRAFSLNKYNEDTQYTVEAEEYLTEAIKKYRIPRTYKQPNYIEIWVEREPLNTFLEHLLGDYDIPVYVTGGYSNYSFIYSACERLRNSVHREGSPRVLYFSDFSVASFQMYDSLLEELAGTLKLTPTEMASIVFKVGVLPEQMVKYDLPVCYTTSKDVKNKKFFELYGDALSLLGLPSNTCVEIEALNPMDLSEIVHNVVFGLLDQAVLSEVAHEEADNIERLRKAFDE